MANHGFFYDAKTVSRILGTGPESDEPAHQAEPPPIVVWYGGWTPAQLRESPSGKRAMAQHQRWYEQYTLDAAPGYYVVQLRVADSHEKTWEEQRAHLERSCEAWVPAPVAVATTALLLHLHDVAAFPRGLCLRCAEEMPLGHAAIRVVNGQIEVVNVQDGFRSVLFYLAAAQRI